MAVTVALSLLPHVANLCFTLNDEAQEPAASIEIAKHLGLYKKMFGVILVDSSSAPTPKDLIKLKDAVGELADRFPLWATPSARAAETWLENLTFLVKDFEQDQAARFVRSHAPQLLEAEVSLPDQYELVHAVYLGRLQRKVLRRHLGAATPKSARLGGMVDSTIQHLIDTNTQFSGWEEVLLGMIANGQRI